MVLKRIIRGMVGVVLFCMMPVIAMAQDFRVNSSVLAPTSSYATYQPSPYTQNINNTGTYRAITHTMPSMSKPSNCSTVLGVLTDDSQYGTTQSSGTPHGPRRVSEDDHNADPFMPLGDTPWFIMLILSLGYIAFRFFRKKKVKVE